MNKTSGTPTQCPYFAPTSQGASRAPSSSAFLLGGESAHLAQLQARLLTSLSAVRQKTDSTEDQSIVRTTSAVHQALNKLDSDVSTSLNEVKEAAKLAREFKA